MGFNSGFKGLIAVTLLKYISFHVFAFILLEFIIFFFFYA